MRTLSRGVVFVVLTAFLALPVTAGDAAAARDAEIAALTKILEGLDGGRGSAAPAPMKRRPPMGGPRGGFRANACPERRGLSASEGAARRRRGCPVRRGGPVEGAARPRRRR